MSQSVPPSPRHSDISRIQLPSFSIGFLTILLFISVVWLASMLMKVSLLTQWEVSLLGLVMSATTASLWVLANTKLRQFTLQTIRSTLCQAG